MESYYSSPTIRATFVVESSLSLECQLENHCYMYMYAARYTHGDHLTLLNGRSCRCTGRVHVPRGHEVRLSPPPLLLHLQSRSCWPEPQSTAELPGTGRYEVFKVGVYVCTCEGEKARYNSS